MRVPIRTTAINAGRLTFDFARAVITSATMSRTPAMRIASSEADENWWRLIRSAPMYAKMNFPSAATWMASAVMRRQRAAFSMLAS